MERKKRSEKMTAEERKAFLKYIKSFETKYDAKEALSVSRPTLDNLIFKGSGKPDTIQKIRKMISQNTAAA
jgi:hypothetical protein